VNQEDAGRELQLRRMALGLSTIDIAAEASLSLNTVFRIEAGGGGLRESWDRYEEAIERLEAKKAQDAPK
jgi:transcriptional regulator with XRE-family HTH domain